MPFILVLSVLILVLVALIIRRKKRSVSACRHNKTGNKVWPKASTFYSGYPWGTTVWPLYRGGLYNYIEGLFCTQTVHLGPGCLAVISQLAFILYSGLAVKRGSTVKQCACITLMYDDSVRSSHNPPPPTHTQTHRHIHTHIHTCRHG